jgi:hypothetical protein
MNVESDKKGSGLIAMLSLVGALLLPVLYVLSIGPMSALAFGNGAAPRWYFVLYAPLLWICNYCDPFDSFLAWYVMLWR